MAMGMKLQSPPPRVALECAGARTRLLPSASSAPAKASECLLLVLVAVWGGITCEAVSSVKRCHGYQDVTESVKSVQSRCPSIPMQVFYVMDADSSIFSPISQQT